MPKMLKFEWLQRCGDLTVFQNGSRLPSWICPVLIACTHNDYLVVSIVVQNLVGIDGVVFDNMKVLVFFVFGLKTPVHAQKFGFGGI